MRQPPSQPYLLVRLVPLGFFVYLFVCLSTCVIVIDMCLFVCLCVFVCKEEQAKSAKAAGVYLLISSAGVTFEWGG